MHKYIVLLFPNRRDSEKMILKKSSKLSQLKKSDFCEYCETNMTKITFNYVKNTIFLPTLFN